MPTNAPTKEARFAAKIATDPLFFQREILGGGALWHRQEEIFKAVKDHRRVAIKAGYNLGKTYSIARLALWFLYSKPHSIVITTASTNRQVKTLLWGEIRKAHRYARVPLGGQLDMTSLKIDEDWYALGFSTDEPTNVQGFHAKRAMVIIDEASGVAPDIVESLEGAISGEDCRMVMVGNPLTPTGAFYDAFKSPAWHKITISCLEHPNVTSGKEVIAGMVTREWVEDKARRWGKDSPLYVSRVMGEFPEGAGDSLIQIAWVDRAKTNVLEVPHDAKIEAGLDVADGGGDESVFTVKRGGKVLTQVWWSNVDTMGTCGRAVQLCNEWKVDVLKVDPIGIGAGVTSRLKELNGEGIIKADVYGVNVAEKSNDPFKFENKRDEIFFGLADRFRDNEIDLSAIQDSEELFSQLVSIKKDKPTSKGQLKVAKKDHSNSPDRADSLALAFATVTDENIGVYIDQN